MMYIELAFVLIAASFVVPGKYICNDSWKCAMGYFFAAIILLNALALALWLLAHGMDYLQ